jgi:hypothetical protein
MKLIIKIVLLMMLPLSGFGVVKYNTIRPLELQVVDAATKQPLPNMVVYYKLEAVGMPHVLGIPLIDPVRFRDVRMERFVTDENGKVYIPEYRMWLRLYESPSTEIFTVNLDTEQEGITPQDKIKKIFDCVLTVFIESRLENIFRPDEQHKGNISVVSPGPSLKPGMHPSRKLIGECCVVEWKSAEFQKAKQFITIELERADAKWTGATQEIR